MKPYKSPSHKLISFFEQSRNQWKDKYMNLKRVVKQLKNRIYFLERSKEHWKHKAKTLESELRQKEGQFAQKESAFFQAEEALKKN